MEISLSGDFDNFIKEQMATGLYSSVNDIVRDAMKLFVLTKSIPQERINSFNKELEQGLNDIVSGNCSDGDSFFKDLMTKYE